MLTHFIRFLLGNVAFVFIGYEAATSSTPHWIIEMFALRFCVVLAFHYARVLVRAYDHQDRAMGALPCRLARSEEARRV